MKKNKVSIISTLFAAALTACGGGGGGTPTSPAITPATGAALDLATSYLLAFDKSLISAIPASGTEALASTDGVH